MRTSPLGHLPWPIRCAVAIFVGGIVAVIFGSLVVGYGTLTTLVEEYAGGVVTIQEWMLRSAILRRIVGATILALVVTFLIHLPRRHAPKINDEPNDGRW